MTADDLNDLAVFAEGLAVDTKAFVAASVAAAVAEVTAAYAPRLAALESEIVTLRAIVPTPGPVGPAGAAGLDGKDGAAGMNGRDGIDGKDGAVGLTGKDGRDGIDGKDGAVGLTGKDGQPGLSGKDGRDGIDGKDGTDGLQGKDGRDGVGLTGALVTRQGTLALTLSDGQTKDVGPVVADGDLVSRLVADLVETFPRPKDGAPGPAGKDGTLEHLQIVYDGKRTITFCQKDGGPIEGGVLVLPLVLDEGVWQQGTAYQKGAGVTWDGSYWIAQEATRARPGAPGHDARDWRLSVKRGSPGKDGKDGKDRE